MPKNKHLRLILTIFYTLLVAFALWLFVRHMLWLILPFLIGFILSRALLRPVRVLRSRLHVPERLSAGVLTLLCCGALGTGLYYAGIGIAHGVVALAHAIINFFTVFRNRFSDFIAQLEQTVEGFGLSLDVGDSLISALQELATGGLSGTLVPGVLKTAGSVPQILLFIVAVILSTFFFITEDAAVKLFVRRLLREKLYSRLNQTKSLLFDGLFGWLKAQAILCGIIFSVLTVGFFIIGNSYAPLIALCIAVLDVLPVLGSGTVLIPWAVIALIMGNYRYAIGCIVLYLVCLFVRNMLESRIIGHQIGLHPLVTLISLYVGFCLFGVLGMFILPVATLLVVNFNRWGYIHIWENGDPAPADPSPAEPPSEG